MTYDLTIDPEESRGSGVTIRDAKWFMDAKETPSLGDIRIRRRQSNYFSIQIFTTVPIIVDGERSNILTWKTHPGLEWPLYTLEEAIEAIKTLHDVDNEDTRYYYPPLFEEDKK